MRHASLRSISSHSNEPVCDHLILCIHLKLNGPILNHACTLTAFRLRISTRPCPLHASSARAPSHSALLLAVKVSSRGVITGYICRPSAVITRTLPHCHHAWPISQLSSLSSLCGRLTGRPAHCHRARTGHARMSSHAVAVTRCCCHALSLSSGTPSSHGTFVGSSRAHQLPCRTWRS